MPFLVVALYCQKCLLQNFNNHNIFSLNQLIILYQFQSCFHLERICPLFITIKNNTFLISIAGEKQLLFISIFLDNLIQFIGNIFVKPIIYNDCLQSKLFVFPFKSNGSLPCSFSSVHLTGIFLYIFKVEFFLIQRRNTGQKIRVHVIYIEKFHVKGIYTIFIRSPCHVFIIKLSLT